MEHDMEGELRRIEPVLTEILGRPSRCRRCNGRSMSRRSRDQTLRSKRGGRE